jgi:hypothetical protein
VEAYYRLKKELERRLIAEEEKALGERRYLLAMFELEQREKQVLELGQPSDDPDIDPMTGLRWGLRYDNEGVVVAEEEQTEFASIVATN